MTRDATTAALDAAQERIVRPVALLRLALDSGDVLATSAPFSVFWAWDGSAQPAEFLGVGNMGRMSAVEEGTEVKPYSVSVQLSGIPQSHVSIALGEDYRNRDMQVWLALLDDQHQVIDHPVLLNRVRLDTMNIELGETATIEATGHSRLADWDRARVRRYTDADQQAVYPNDKGFQFVSQISAGKELIWGKT